MKLPGRSGIEDALALVGERLAHAGASATIVIVGGAAMNLLGFVDRPTLDVDVLAGLGAGGALAPPDPLPEELVAAVRAVARDRGLLERWINTAVADQWRFGLPSGLEGRIHWRRFGGLTVGLVDRRDLVFFKLYASADQVGPESVHVRDLLALRPSVAELAEAARWVCAQDPSPDFHAVVAKVVSYVRDALR